MDPSTLILLAQLVAQVGTIMGQLTAVAQRIEAGETVTQDELLTLRRQTAAAVARWNDAADKDKP